MNFEINLNIRLVARVCISDTLQPYGVNNLGSLLKIRAGNLLEIREASEKKDGESIVLLTGGCRSEDRTILNF